MNRQQRRKLLRKLRLDRAAQRPLWRAFDRRPAGPWKASIELVPTLAVADPHEAVAVVGAAFVGLLGAGPDETATGRCVRCAAGWAGDRAPAALLRITYIVPPGGPRLIGLACPACAAAWPSWASLVQEHLGGISLSVVAPPGTA